jgi:hypothetical protein
MMVIWLLQATLVHKYRAVAQTLCQYGVMAPTGILGNTVAAININNKEHT